MNQGQGKRKLVKRLTAFVLGLLLTQALPVLAQKDETPSYSDLLSKIDAGKVQRVEIYEKQQIAKVWLLDDQPADKANKGKPDFEIPIFDENPTLFKRLNTKTNIQVEVIPDQGDNPLVGLLVQLFLGLFLIFLLLMFLRRLSSSNSGPGQILNFGKSKARFHMEAETGITFEDVAGIEEAKEELQEVVTFLKQPERFTAVGARIPRGALLVGPPGTGKTLLAKAIAGEAGVPFFSLSGSEFVEMFVGVGASRVRDLFKKAKENAPCLVFIDEIDAVGRQRGVGIGGGNDEREQTLNQLLTEMDGFEDNTGVIIIAATNRPDVLDNALLRPGRFDRQITVDLPSYKDRLKILEVHAREKKLADDVSLDNVARLTPGLSGAALANLMNEAAILTARRRKDVTTSTEIDDAIDRVTIGLTLTPHMDSKKKWIIAYHEVGHAFLMTVLKDTDPLQKVTILPRPNGVQGFAMPMLDEERQLPSRAALVDKMVVYLGGRAAEVEVFGDAEVTVGAGQDLKAVTEIARAMVTQLGMSDLGYLALEKEDSGPGYAGMGWPSPPQYSEEIAVKIDHRVHQMIRDCYQQARELIRDNRELIDKLVEVLLERETLEGEEFRQIARDYGQALEKKSAIPVPLSATATVQA